MHRNSKVLPLVAALAALLFAVPAFAFFGGGGNAGGAKEGSPAPMWNSEIIWDAGKTVDPPVKIDFAQLKGKKVICLDFWSIYCASCIEAMPRLVEIYNDYKDRGFVMVGVNLDSFGTHRVVKFLQGMETKIAFPVIIDKTRTVATSFNAMVLPTSIVIDIKGNIVFYHVGYKAGDEKKLRAVVDKAVKELKK